MTAQSRASSGPSELAGHDFSFFEALTFDPPKELRNPAVLLAETQLQNARPPASLTSPSTHTNYSRAAPSIGSSTQDLHRAPTQMSKPSVEMPKALLKSHQKCITLCRQTNKASDRIAVHLLEYLTTVSHVPFNLNSLAHTFLDMCHVLYSLEAGLAECGLSTPALPAEMLGELEKKFRIAQTDFQVLDNMLSKLLDYERKGTMGKMRKGWGKMFGDNDPERINVAIVRTKDSLKMSALVFQWTLGDQKIKGGMGIGYTGLAAALDRLDHDSGRVTTPAGTGATQVQPPPGSASNSNANAHLSPAATWGERSSSFKSEPQPHVPAALPPTVSSLSPVRSTTEDMRRQYVATSGSSTASGEQISPAVFDRISAIDDVVSQSESTDSDTILENFLSLDLGGHDKAVRLKVDPFTLPRWTPRNSTGAESEGLRSALITAMRQKSHQQMEQLLDRGALPSPGTGVPMLREAVNLQDTESIKLLLLFGADPNEADRQNVTPLLAAVQKSFLSGALTLLKYGADPNLLAGPDLESPLSVAVAAGNTAFVHVLLIYGGASNHIDSEGSTILISSIGKKTPKKIVDLLLDYDADPDAKNSAGQTALFRAIDNKRVDITRSLLDHGANPNLPGPKHMLWPSTYSTPCLELLLAHGADHKKCPGIMELASSINNIESVRVLLKAGVSPNLKKDSVYTPLCSAIRDNRVEIVELLLKNGADPNLMASEYPAFKCITHKRLHLLPTLVAAGASLTSPKGIVETAVSSQNMEALQWLLDRGLDPDQRNAKGCSPLTSAIRDGRMDMVDVLLARGADPNKRGEDWPVCMAVRNPPILGRILSVLTEPRAFKGVMEMAVAANQLESVKLLLVAGVSVEDKNGGVFSPLTTAIREDMKDIVIFLINEGNADVNAPGEHLPLIKAIRRHRGDDTSIIEMLLEHGADPNLVYRGWSGIIQAIQTGDLQILKLLAAKGVDLDVRDDMGMTVVDLAESRGWDEAVSVLKAGRMKS